MQKMLAFTEKEKTYDGTNGVVFDSPGDSRRLGFYFPFGWIEYTTKETHRGQTNLVDAVPNEKQALKLTMSILSQVGIKTSDLDKNETNGKPHFRYYSGETIYFLNHTFITNLYERAVRFRRAVDGFTFIGADAGGQGMITFGEHGEITKMDLYWRNLKRFKVYATATPETITDWIRNGKAVENGIPMNELPIDWNTVKSVTVKKADIIYYGGMPGSPSDWLIPLASLWATVERGNGATIDLEIDCPVYQETP